MLFVSIICCFYTIELQNVNSFHGARLSFDFKVFKIIMHFVAILTMHNKLQMTLITELKRYLSITIKDVNK